MIAQEDIDRANQQFRDCLELETHDGFKNVMLAEIKQKRQEFIDSGRNLSLTPAQRSEYHRASHFCDELLGLVDRRKLEAVATLKQAQQEKS